jgi:hypothetical protein
MSVESLRRWTSWAKIHRLAFYNYWHQNCNQRHVYFPVETQERHISHGRMGRYKSYSFPAMCKPASLSLRSAYQQVFIAEGGRTAFKVVVSSVPLTPSGMTDSNAVLSLTRFDKVTVPFRILKFVSQFTVFYVTLSLITVLTRVNHWRLSWAS